jgi:uncharacterized membrane protein (UPF0127 family)
MDIKNKIYIFVLVLAVYSLSIFISMPFANDAVGYFEDIFLDEKLSAVIGESSIDVIIADTEESRIKGLSGRKELGSNEGMYFIFDRPGEYGIWMKDMLIPIDIIWLDSHNEVIYIEENVSTDTYPKVFKPNKPALYVLELNAGFVNEHKIKKGDLFTLI